ncbi:uncharacterized protein [Panulirus ornatus]|uniref:uncharacterized protein n=1 Tax=Panulirus ornatus TaxID=150431 RepID=UPI003A8C398F
MHVVVLMLLLLTGSRAAPTSGTSHFFPRSRRSNPTNKLDSFRLPDNFTIYGTCLATILRGLCEGLYYHTTSSNYDQGSDSFFCKGMECSLGSLSDYCNKSTFHAPTVNWNGRSQPQSRSDKLPDTNNMNPFCQRYMYRINMARVIRDGGWACGKKLDCVCGNCCSPQSKKEVLKMMMEEKYTNLVRRLPKMAQKGRIFQDRQAIHPRQSPVNVPLTTTNAPCLHQPC